MTFSKHSDKYIVMVNAFRRKQALLAYTRDNSKCVFCWFLDGKITKAEEAHHVFGRNKKVLEPFIETYFCILSTCRHHHPQPILNGVEKEWKKDILTVLRMANEKPINREFTHPWLVINDLGRTIQPVGEAYNLWTTLQHEEPPSLDLQKG